ncbi:hypothetical protein M5D96_003394 [Drosophila gunungcola]|uniref:Uncharacterized protein n=1 Tax=Drosophila gunungcola TaxID=103775 RepID=A0A9Q0BSF0_9MUSC|nr:hypothetical protein M5D96_003394 [Drosophila gunungcola]
MDPATTRIPRLDGVSRLPKPSSFGLASSSCSTTNKTTTNSSSSTTTTQHIRPPTSAPKATQIFRAPSDPAKPRPVSSYAPSSAALRDLGSSLKKSASGERINNAVSLLSKRTTTVLKKYFSPKSSPSAVMSNPSEMTSSLPVTPLPVGKRGMISNDQLTSSTPMPLLRSETFVCEDEEQVDRINLESTRLSTFGRTMDLDSPTSNETKVLVKDATRIMKGDFTKVIHQGANLTLSMDQLPLLEHISMPSGLDILSSKGSSNLEKLDQETDDTLDVTLTSLAPNKTSMKLPLNSTLNTERLLDISALQSPRHIQLLNLTQELERGTPSRGHLQSGRRSIPQHSLLCLSPQSATTTPHGMRMMGQATPQPVHLLSPLLKQAQSALVLPTRTPDGDIAMDGNGALDNTLTSTSGRARTRYSFGLDLPDTTLDCSIELVDNSFSSSTQLQQLQQQLLKKQSSFDLDESLGILTPDQMKDFLDSPHNNLMHNLELIRMHHPNLMQLRMEQTPSPEELPLDPIEIKSEIVKQVEASQNQVTTSQHSKLSNSFITSVTSVTSLDTGYQGDGEMSRPASRGACDHSPSNGPHLGRVSRQPSFPPPNPAPLRRQDPMTDSDFFTESDADDVLHRGDRRAQVIDGQLYGPDMMQPSASVPQMEDSCMESSGIFTDVENRCDEEMRQPELEVDVDVDMSPDDSTQTMRKGQGQQPTPTQQNQLAPQQRPPSSCLSSSSAATTLSLSLSNRTSYCSVDGGSARSFCGDEAFASAAVRSPVVLSVQKTTSPRPHASLSSLCTVETFRGSVSSNSSIASPKSCKSSATKTGGKSRVLKSPKSPKSPRSPLNRKAHTPNKWDAVMNKIASNKSLIKTNYNDVKSKVSSTRIMTPASGSSPGSGSGSGSVSAASPRGSPSVSASARRSPSATPKVPPKLLLAKRSSSSSCSSSKAHATPSPPPHATPPTRQPLDKGSVGAGSVGGGGGLGNRAGKAPPKSPTSPSTPTSPPAKRLQSTLVSR